MKGNAWAIARKELARFFSNKASALVSIVLPGLLIFLMWTFMGDAMGGMFKTDMSKPPTVAVVNAPESVKALAADSIVDMRDEPSLPGADEMRERIEQGDVKAFAVFPEGFDEAVAAYDPASGVPAPQVEIYFNSTDPDSSQARSTFAAMLDSYESSLSNRFDVNAGGAGYDVAEERDVAGMLVVSIVPLLLLILVFSSVMSIAASRWRARGARHHGHAPGHAHQEARYRAGQGAGHHRHRPAHRGVQRHRHLLGAARASCRARSTSNVYGPVEYVLLALVILSTTLVIVALITVVSTLAKSVKEATMFLTPLMIVVMLVGVLGMFGDAKAEVAYYLVPLYNSVQCMIGIFSFDFQPLNVAVCVIANLAYAGVGMLALQRMFDSERLMFAR